MNAKKLRTVEQLSDFLQNELSWRRNEITVISKLLRTQSKTPIYHDSLVRAGVTILYAHWEGYIKIAATAYVCFVAMQRLKYNELSPNFLALYLKAKITQAKSSGDYNVDREIVDFFLSEMNSRSKLSWDTAIDTEANLSSKVFVKILRLLELDYLPEYRTKQNIIDAQLLKNRHDAAHGNRNLEMNDEQLLELFTIFVGDRENRGLLEMFSDQIVNAALLGKYTKT